MKDQNKVLITGASGFVGTIFKLFENSMTNLSAFNYIPNQQFDINGFNCPFSRKTHDLKGFQSIRLLRIQF
jgi:hypothetical protein